MTVESVACDLIYTQLRGECMNGGQVDAYDPTLYTGEHIITQIKEKQ